MRVVLLALLVASLAIALPPAAEARGVVCFGDADCPGDLCYYDVLAQEWTCPYSRCSIRPCPLPP